MSSIATSYSFYTAPDWMRKQAPVRRKSLCKMSIKTLWLFKVGYTPGSMPITRLNPNNQNYINGSILQDCANKSAIEKLAAGIIIIRFRMILEQSTITFREETIIGTEGAKRLNAHRPLNLSGKRTLKPCKPLESLLAPKGQAQLRANLTGQKQRARRCLRVCPLSVTSDNSYPKE